MSKDLLYLIEELRQQPTSATLACAYGVHDMKYERDETGKVIMSTCIRCGACYFGFHS